MAHARGVICLAARQRDVTVMALAPAEVKRAIAAHGAASKAQIQTACSACWGWPRPRGPRTSPTRSPWPSPGCRAGAGGWRDRHAVRAPAARARGPRRAGVRRDRLRGVPAAHRPARGRGAAAEAGDKASELQLVIYYHATRDQPRPVLIGFTSDLDKEFFEKLITVKDIGPMVAARALAAPVAELAAAIARQDEKYLRALPGIGPQKAKNIVAQLQAKVAKFALAARGRAGRAGRPAARRARHRRAARDGVGDPGQAARATARPRPPSSSPTRSAAGPRPRSPEELFDEIYRGQTPPRRGERR